MNALRVLEMRLGKALDGLLDLDGFLAREENRDIRVLALTIREKRRLVDPGHLAQIIQVAANPCFAIPNDVGICDRQRPPTIADRTC
jgi:hypothetical protein